MEDDKIGWF